MAKYIFTKAILNGDEIPLYGDRSTRRDFTHINDIIHGIEKAVENLQGHEIFNPGESHTTSLDDLVSIRERAIGKNANRKLFPMQ